jgi:hypothetical protein
MVESELKSSSSHLGCKTLCCYICPMVKRFIMFKGKVLWDFMKHFHKVEFLNIVCDEFPSCRLVLLLYVWMVLMDVVFVLVQRTRTSKYKVTHITKVYLGQLVLPQSWNGPKRQVCSSTNHCYYKCLCFLALDGTLLHHHTLFGKTKLQL